MKPAFKRSLKSMFTRSIDGPVIVKITTETQGRYGPRVIVRVGRAGGLRPVYIARHDPTGTSMSVDTLCGRMVRDYEGLTAP